MKGEKTLRIEWYKDCDDGQNVLFISLYGNRKGVKKADAENILSKYGYDYSTDGKYDFYFYIKNTRSHFIILEKI